MGCWQQDIGSCKKWRSLISSWTFVPKNSSVHLITLSEIWRMPYKSTSTFCLLLSFDFEMNGISQIKSTLTVSLCKKKFPSWCFDSFHPLRFTIWKSNKCNENENFKQNSTYAWPTFLQCSLNFAFLFYTTEVAYHNPVFHPWRG